MDFASENFEELECPVCFEYFQPPIAICSNGHSICGKCKTKITMCPLCRAGILSTTNITLENVMSKIRVRCEFSAFGCKMTSSIGEIRQHETVCKRRPYKCPITDCTWNRPLSAIRFHLKSKHKIQVQPQLGEITALGDFGNKSVWHTVKSFMGEIFLQVSKLQGDELYTSVLHIGREEITSQFIYTVEISCVHGKETCSALQMVRNYADGLDRIIRLRKCAIFSRNIFQNCLTKRRVLKIKVRMLTTLS
jgi:E3 ubiquitin-protein ligase SIAH1